MSEQHSSEETARQHLQNAFVRVEALRRLLTIALNKLEAKGARYPGQSHG
jgi:hypothetical protein